MVDVQRNGARQRAEEMNITRCYFGIGSEVNNQRIEIEALAIDAEHVADVQGEKLGLVV